MARKSSVARAAKGGLAFTLRAIARLLGVAKTKASGVKWRRLHRIESELATVSGTKSPLHRAMKKALTKKRAGIKS